MDAASVLMVGISLPPWLDLIALAVSMMSRAFELNLDVPVAIGLLMLGLVGAILGLIKSWAQNQTDDVDA